MASKQETSNAQRNVYAATEQELKNLQERNQQLEATVSKLQEELLEIRARTDSELAAAQDRLYWMDENYLGPEVVARRRYLKLFVRILNYARYIAARMRKLRRP